MHEKHIHNTIQADVYRAMLTFQGKFTAKDIQKIMPDVNRGTVSGSISGLAPLLISKAMLTSTYNGRTSRSVSYESMVLPDKLTDNFMHKHYAELHQTIKANGQKARAARELISAQAKLDAASKTKPVKTETPVIEDDDPFADLPTVKEKSSILDFIRTDNPNMVGKKLTEQIFIELNKGVILELKVWG